MIKVWYLHHSSFALLINNKLFIFDYYYDKPANDFRELASGVINPEQIKEYDVYVFVSHRHQDHFSDVIFEWSETLPDITYILSDDIAILAKNTHKLAANESYIIDELKIDTLKSNDEGIAFIIKTEGLTIFFSGDLNWWHWEGEPDSWNKEKELEFKMEYDKLKQYSIDIAFIPVDPRLEHSYSKTLEYYLGMDHNSIIFPMHFGNDYSVFEWLAEDKLDRYVKKINKRGQEYIIGD